MLETVPRDGRGVNPANLYTEAVARITTLQADESQLDLNPVCRTRLLSHGQKVEKVMVFLHGFTSCPQQFTLLAEQYFEFGYNVYLPRLPYHGMNDRFANNLRDTTVEELIAFADSVVDIAIGLGDQVIISGLSGGGTVALWIGQFRPEVDLVVAIAPFLGIGFIPSLLNGFVYWFLPRFPDFYYWWDPLKREQNPLTVYYAYPGLSSHGLAELFHMGHMVRSAAEKEHPAGKGILIVTNANDRTVNNHETAQLVTTWRKNGVEVQTYEFERALLLPHDLIGAHRPDQNIELVYPILIELTSQALAKTG